MVLDIWTEKGNDDVKGGFGGVTVREVPSRISTFSEHRKTPSAIGGVYIVIHLPAGQGTGKSREMQMR